MFLPSNTDDESRLQSDRLILLTSTATIQFPEEMEKVRSPQIRGIFSMPRIC
jgi:hypothetical protein